MKIIFDLVNCGLGNNGGSLTLIKSANVLNKLGQDVLIIDSGSNRNTWESLDIKHLVITNDSQIPSADFIVATGYRTVEHVLKQPKRCGIKIHWIRGWETWNFSEKKIISSILSTPTIKFVNGICLQNKLNSLGFDSYIVRPGYDIESYFPLINEFSRNNRSFTMGGLYNEGRKRVGKRTEWIFSCFKELRKIDSKVQLVMFGSEGIPNEPISYYRKNPDLQTKNQIYNMCHIWLAPTELEGLHIAPAEAMLTGCPVLGTTSELSGMADYLFGGMTGIVTSNNFNSFYQGLKCFYMDWESLVSELGENARNQILDMGSREQNMQKFIDVLIDIKENL